MTWGQLKKYIEKNKRKLLKEEVKIYNFRDGEEYSVDITELLFGEDDTSGWIPYLTINHEENDNEYKAKAKETGIN